MSLSQSTPSQMAFLPSGRLPSNKFLVRQKVWRPRVIKQTYNSAERVQIVIEGSPNEYLLPVGAYLHIGYKCVGRNGKTVGGENTQISLRRVATDHFVGSPLWGPSAVQSSRESVQTNSMPLLENNDRSLCLANNTLRAIMAHRVCETDRYGESNAFVAGAGFDSSQYASLGDGYGDSRYTLDQKRIIDLENAGFRPYLERYYQVQHNNQSNVQIQAEKFSSSQQIPLGFVSDLANSNSVIPLGLLSSYSSNGWTIEVELAELSRFATVDVDGLEFGSYTVVFDNIEIRGVCVKSLDDDFNNLIQGLYSNQLSDTVNGVNIALSLRMHMIKHRFQSLPHSAGTTRVVNRIPCTEKSVRGLAAMAVTTEDIPSGSTAFPATSGVAVHNHTCQMGIAREQLRMGSLDYMVDYVEAVNPQDGRIASFHRLNKDKVGHVFSPFPWWLEKNDGSNHQYGYWQTLEGKLAGSIAEGKISLSVFSFENVDHDAEEGVRSVVSGVDVSQVGSFEHDFQPVVNVNSAWAVNDKATTMLYCTASDQIVEVSVSGVYDVTNTVL